MESKVPVERLALMFFIWIQTSQRKATGLTGGLQASRMAANQVSRYLKLGHDCSRNLFLIYYPPVIRHLKTASDTSIKQSLHKRIYK
jgi:hypothetical protein